MNDIWDKRTTLEKTCIIILLAITTLFLCKKYLFGPMAKDLKQKKQELITLSRYTGAQLSDKEQQLLQEENRSNELSKSYSSAFGSLTKPDNSEILRASVLINNILEKNSIQLISRNEQKTNKRLTSPRIQGQYIINKNLTSDKQTKRYESLTKESVKYKVRGTFNNLYLMLLKLDTLPILCEINDIDIVLSEDANNNVNKLPLDMSFTLNIYIKKGDK